MSEFVRPEAFILPINNDKGNPSAWWTFIIDNITTLSAFWVLNWYRTLHVKQVWIDVSNLNSGDAVYYRPKLKEKKLNLYDSLAQELYTLIDAVNLKQNSKFGLLPMNTLMTMTLKVDTGFINYRSESWDIDTFKKRVNRCEFPVSDFGYVQAAIENAKKKWAKEYGKLRSVGEAWEQQEQERLKEFVK